MFCVYVSLLLIVVLLVVLLFPCIDRVVLSHDNLCLSGEKKLQCCYEYTRYKCSNEMQHCYCNKLEPGNNKYELL